MTDPVLARAVAQLAAQVAQTQQAVRLLRQSQTTSQLGQSSIDDGFLTVVSGGTIRQIIGLQPDGTVTTVDQNGTAPPAPSTPTVSAAAVGLTVAWDGAFSGGVDKPLDFADVEVHVSTSSGFTPSTATLRAALTKAGQTTVAPLTAGTTYYVVLVAVNTSGIKSTASSQSSGVPNAVLLGPVTASQIGYIGVLNFNPYFTGGDITGWSAGGSPVGSVSTTSSQPTGSPYAYALELVASSTGTGTAHELAPAFPALPGQQYMVSGLFYTPGSAVDLGLSFTLAGSFVSDVTQTLAVTPNTWTQLTAVITAPSSGIDGAGPVFSTDAETGTYTMYGQAVIALPQVPGGLIQAGTITATQLAAASVTAGAIAAGTVVAGIVDGTTMHTASLEVSSSGTGNGIFVYNGVPNSGNLIISLTSQAGTDPYGNDYPAGISVQAQSGTIDGSNLVDGTLAGTALAAQTITADLIALDSITSAQLAAASVSATELAEGAVYSGAIQTGAVDTNAIAANAIVAGLIAAGAIDAMDINTGTLTVSGGQGQILVYDGVAALGTLFVSIAGEGGIDDFGNSYPAGIAITNNGTIIGADLIIQPSQGALIGYSQ